jgi:S-adenosylmethionine decarboxylase
MVEINALGRQLVIDAWGCRELNDERSVRSFLEESVKACKARLLSIDTHRFSPQGISGVAVIAESHISIHTWPEYGYAAIDVFTCGKDVEPYNAIEVIKKFFSPERMTVNEIKRGVSIETIY